MMLCLWHNRVIVFNRRGAILALFGDEVAALQHWL